MALSSASRLALVFCTVLVALPCQAQSRYAVLIGGLGGSPEYTRTLQQYLFDTHAALTGPLGFEEKHVVVLTETAIAETAPADGIANAENIRSTFATLAGQVTLDDHVYVILFGHGSFDGRQAMLNIARRDLSSVDYAQLVNTLPAGRIVFINTASASGPFVAALSAPDRIVITATRSGTQRNLTVFPRFLVEALSSPSADLDRNGSLSVLEIYNYAALQTSGHFEENGHLATEHALLDDTGDGEGARQEDLANGPDGNLAAVTYLRRTPLAAHKAGTKPIERKIPQPKPPKPSMAEKPTNDPLKAPMFRRPGPN